MFNPFRARVEQLMREGKTREEAMELAADYPEHQNKLPNAPIPEVAETMSEVGLRPEARMRKRERMRDIYLEQNQSEPANELQKKNEEFVKIRDEAVKNSHQSVDDADEGIEQRIKAVRERAKLNNQDQDEAERVERERFEAQKELVESAQRMNKESIDEGGDEPKKTRKPAARRRATAHK